MRLFSAKVTFFTDFRQSRVFFKSRYNVKVIKNFSLPLTSVLKIQLNSWPCTAEMNRPNSIYYVTDLFKNILHSGTYSLIWKVAVTFFVLELNFEPSFRQAYCPFR